MHPFILAATLLAAPLATALAETPPSPGNAGRETGSGQAPASATADQAGTAAAPAAETSASSLLQELQELRKRLQALQRDPALAAPASAGPGGDTPTPPAEATAATAAAQERPADMRPTHQHPPQLGDQRTQPAVPAGGAVPIPEPEAAPPAVQPDDDARIGVLEQLRQFREELARMRSTLQSEQGRLQGGGASAEQEAPAGPKSYVRSPLASALIKDEMNRFSIWVNPAKWTLAPYKQNPEAAFEFVHTSGDAYAFVIAENVTVPVETLTKMALKNAQMAAPDATFAYEDRRLVNGAEVLCLRINGTIDQLIPFTYLGYYHTGKVGTIQMVASTAFGKFDAYEADLLDLLNGLQIYGGS